MKRNEKLPMLDFRARFESKSFDDSDNSVEVIFTTNERVLRMPFFDEPFYEELGMKKSMVRMDRLNGGAPVLNNHRSGDLSDVIGTTVSKSAKVDGEQGTVKIRFSDRDDVKGIVQDVKSGILSNISVGYVVHKFKELKETQDDIRVLRAVDWEPFEVSVVGIPADKNAKIRNEDTETLYDVNIISVEGDENMKTKEEIAAEKKAAELKAAETKTVETVVEKEVEVREIKVADEEAVKLASEEATKAERKRTTEVRKVCATAKMSDEETAKFIEDGTSCDEVRKLVLEKMAKEDETREVSNVTVEVTKDEIETVRKGMTDSILARSSQIGVDGKQNFEHTENSRQYANFSMLRMAREIVQRSGVETRNMTDKQVAERALHHTTDFPIILAEAIGTSLRKAYEAAPQTFQPFTRMVSNENLEEMNRAQLGEGGALLEVKEGDEYKHDTISESKESYRVKKYGKIINITEEVIIKDRLDAFGRLPALFGQRAKDLESDLVWDQITSNPDMSDGNAVYSAAHANLNSGGAGALAIGSLGDARSAFRKQVGLDQMKLNLNPMWLYVPTSLETAAEQLVSSITPAVSGEVNPFNQTGRTPLRLGVEPRLDDVSATAWYMFGMLSQVDMVELATLNGQGPEISSQVGFDVDGLRIKIKHWAGAKVIDHRGLNKNDGV